ncbi:hypothetical protein [Streptomyces sp. NPDC046978]|uniref:hypothetical protein n=1 Tax=Streptomyces sp. NPDC046978 TaxID=3154704 RepID=UPI0033D956D5
MSTLAVGDLAKGTWLGAITLSGIAAFMMLALFFGVRGSDRVKINTKERITCWGLLTGSVCLAAGGNWVDLITGVGTIPKSVMDQSGLPDFGPAGLGACLVLISIAHGYKRKWIHAGLALAASKYLIDGGGIGAVVLNAARVSIGHWGA